MSKWKGAKRGAEYADEGYRNFLKKLKSGEIRSVKRGKKYLTTKKWIDEYLFSLEINQPKAGMLVRN